MPITIGENLFETITSMPIYNTSNWINTTSTNWTINFECSCGQDHGTGNFYTYKEALTTTTPIQNYRQWTIDEEAQWVNWGNLKVDKKLEAAKKKALTLLRENLSRKQWTSYKSLGYFEVISQNGNVYRIYEGRSRNIKLIRDGKAVTTICAHPKMQVPNGDTLLAQKLMLECAEQEFLNIANIDYPEFLEEGLALAA